MSAVPGHGRRWSSQPGRVLTIAEIETMIADLCNDIEDLLDQLHGYAMGKAQAEHDYGLAKAKRNLEAGAMPGNGRGGQTTVDEREAIVKRDTEAQWLDHLVSEAHYEVCRERIHAKRDELGALRTIAANIRAITTTTG